MDEKQKKRIWSALFALTVFWLLMISASAASPWLAIEFKDKYNATTSVAEFTLTTYDVTTTGGGKTEHYHDSISNLQKSDNTKVVFANTAVYVNWVWLLAVLSFALCGINWVRAVLWDPIAHARSHPRARKLDGYAKKYAFLSFSLATAVVVVITALMLLIVPLYFATAIQEAAKKDYQSDGSSTSGGAAVAFGSGPTINVGSYTVLMDRMTGLYIMLFAFFATLVMLAFILRKQVSAVSKHAIGLIKRKGSGV